MQKDLGMKWLKVCKILWLIGAAICIYFIWLTLIGSAIVFSAFPAYTLVCVALCLTSSFLTALAYTAVSSFCASRFKYIIALFGIAPISAAINAYGSVITEDGGTKLIMSSGCFAIVALAWSLPNIIYFMHRKHLFTGTDPDSDTTEPVCGPDAGAENAESKAAEEKPKHEIEVHKVKVIPVKIGSGKQENQIKQMKEEPQESEKAGTVKSVKKKSVSTYVFIILLAVVSAVCVWQATQLSAARDNASNLQRSITALKTQIEVQESVTEKKNEIIDDLNDRIDKLEGEVNRLLGYRKYLTAADWEELERNYQKNN